MTPYAEDRPPSTVFGAGVVRQAHVIAVIAAIVC